MKTIEFTLSDFSSLQKELLTESNFSETTYNYLIPKEKSNNNYFFRRIFIESGLEIWVFSMRFGEDTLLKQIKSKDLFCATHFCNFDGIFYSNEILKDEAAAKGIYVTNGRANLNFKIKADEKINLVSFVYSKRWLEINLLNTKYFTELFDEKFSLKKYFFKDTFKYPIAKVMRLAQKNENAFLTKLSILTNLNSLLDFITIEPPIDKIERFSVIDFVQQVEEMLSNDFETPIKDIYTEVIKNGFNKDAFITTFKTKTNHSLLDYRQIRRTNLVLKLLEDGHKTNIISKKTGFRNEEKFHNFFEKQFKTSPENYKKTIDSLK